MMKWMRLSVDAFTDDKITQLNHSEQILYLKLIAWSVAHETDGRIPASSIDTIAAGHRHRQRYMDHLCGLGLLQLQQGSDTVTTGIQQGYNIQAFAKWQMTTERIGHKPAGQAPGDQSSSRGRASAGTETRLERSSISLSEDTLAPVDVVEVKDPRLAAVLGRIGKKLGEANGTATNGSTNPH
jgi:hypothetical protein